MAALSAEQQVDLADRARTIPPVRLPSLAELQLRRGGLTPAQDVVFRLVSDGHSAKQIAALLGRSIKTVDAHMVAVHRVMGAGDRVTLARYAIRLGLVEV